MLAILFAITSCKPSVPDRYIQPDVMEDLLYDYHLAQSIASLNRSDSSSYYKNSYYYSVLNSYNVTEAEFDSSMVYYYTHAKLLHEIYRNITERMNSVAMAHGASSGEIDRYSQYSSHGDTANIWQESLSACLMPVPTKNKFEFQLDADTTYRRGDSFLFNFNTTFMYQSGTKDAMVYLAVRYANDSIKTYNRRVSVSGLTQMRIPAVNDLDISSISGFIILNRGNDDSKTLKLMFIDQLQLIRFHPVRKESDSEKQDSKPLSAGTISPSPVSTDKSGAGGKQVPIRQKIDL